MAEQIEQAIHDGELAPGDRIANEVALADQLGLSRPTLRQAIQTLVDKGMLVRKRGVGTQVVNAPIRRTVELTSLYDDLTRSGLRPTTTRAGARPGARRRGGGPEAEHALRATGSGGSRRLRAVKDEPLALMCNLVPEGVTDLSLVDLDHTGLYEHFRRPGDQPARGPPGDRGTHHRRRRGHDCSADARATRC